MLNALFVPLILCPAVGEIGHWNGKEKFGYLTSQNVSEWYNESLLFKLSFIRQSLEEALQWKLHFTCIQIILLFPVHSP